MGSLLHESGSAHIDQPHHPVFIQHPVFVMEKGHTILNQYLDLEAGETREEVLSKILSRIIEASDDTPIEETQAETLQ